MYGAAYGIIPARAGFTGWTWFSHTWAADHPRSRGVYVDSSGVDDVLDGSSPLARGLPAAHVSATNAARIIPARAGFTPSG